MRKLQLRVHSPAALFAFEAAARHLSFTNAARELNVSQPAVSQAIKRVERALGSKLFQRRHRAIALTEAGERFYSDVSFGLMHILRSAERIAMEGGASHVTLSVSTAFANYWMVPRLAAFKANNSEVDIRLQTTDRDIDLAAESVSLAIRRGGGRWEGYDCFRLAGEEIFPVCSPAFLKAAGKIESAARVIDRELIHLEEPYRPRPTWADWFRAQGVGYRDGGEGLRLNDYALVIQAAIAGEGIALGWRHIVAGLIEQRLLVKAFDASYAEGEDFYVLWSNAQPLSPQAQRVLDWLRSQAEPR